MSKLETNTIDNISGSSTLTIGDSNASTISIPKNITLGASGTTITVPSGATITNNGTQTGFGGDNTPAFSATLSSTQNASNNVTTEIVFNSKHFDTDSAYNTSNGRFTVPAGEGGKYLFSVSLRFNNATSNRNAVDIQINGSADGQNVAFENTGAQYMNLSGSVIMNLNAGDYVSVLYYQTSGGTITVRTDSQFSGFKLIGV